MLNAEDVSITGLFAESPLSGRIGGLALWLRVGSGCGLNGLGLLRWRLMATLWRVAELALDGSDAVAHVLGTATILVDFDRGNHSGFWNRLVGGLDSGKNLLDGFGLNYRVGCSRLIGDGILIERSQGVCNSGRHTPVSDWDHFESGNYGHGYQLPPGYGRRNTRVYY